MILPRGRRCQVDTTGHFCPHPNCSYRGWGAGAIAALTAIPIAAAGDRSFVSVADVGRGDVDARTPQPGHGARKTP
jgi:hypothetical protein